MADTTTRVRTYFTFGPDHEIDAPEWVDREGWFTIEGVDREEARSIMFALFGNRWAFDYAHLPGLRVDGEYDPTWYPKGELARLTFEVRNGS